ncbi:MAG: hypothetical protein SNJ70_00395 [Armatimonadota bacterium]
MSQNADTIIKLICGQDERTGCMMPGWDVEIARQKLIFLTTPSDFKSTCTEIAESVKSAYSSGNTAMHEKAISFFLGIAESLISPVELDHNLQNKKLHGSNIISDEDAKELSNICKEVAIEFANQDEAAFNNVMGLIKAEDLAANKGDNLFGAWGIKWQKDTGNDPYKCINEYLKCFGKLYERDAFYPAEYFARKEGKVKTQFFNDYGLQAARCRRMGSMGGTTNPAIAVMGENDLSGVGNIWGNEAISFINQFPNKWHQVRKIIARLQVDNNMSDDWGATKFTEWVVADAMLGLRSIFLLEGLGRVAYQLRPDWHNDEEKLTNLAGEVFESLCIFVKSFDDILLEGANNIYVNTCKERIGISNNHFKVACTGQAALNVVKSINAGYSELCPKALKTRMFTNVTLSYDVPQMYAASKATQDGIEAWEKRTGQKADDGEGGSVITSMIGRFNDAIRDYRVKSLIEALPADSKFKTINPADVKKLTDDIINNAEFIAEVNVKGMNFQPEAEEDAIDRAGTLATKRVVILLEKNEGWAKTRILTASKRNFFQNTELLDVPFSTDFGNIQRMYIDVMPIKVDNWKTLYDDMNEDGTPVEGSIWAKRHEILSRIWPDWKKSWEIDGVKPDEYINTIYVPPTLTQFTGFWNENVARAKKAADEIR